MGNRVGKQIGNYRLVMLIGAGGFAEVYLGEHIHLGTQAAVKILNTQLSDEDVQHFRQEARFIANLNHHNIIRVLDFDVEWPIAFLVMDYASKGTLRTRHPIGSSVQLDLVVSYTKQVADALQYAHDMNIIHRDVKPENMLLGDNDEILLSDFGIATGSLNTSTQEIVGTPRYMAPEQFEGKPRLASDQYALATVVYEWLCGQQPFNDSGSALKIAYQIVSMPPPPLRQFIPSISQDVERVVLKALAKNPNDRFANVKEFAAALEEASRRAILQADNIQLPETSSRGRPDDPTMSVGSEFSHQLATSPGQVSSPGQTHSFFRRMKTQAQGLFHKIDPIRTNIIMHTQDLQQKFPSLGEQIGTNAFKLLQKSGQVLKDTPFRQPGKSGGSSTILFPNTETTSDTPTSFFISYHKADRIWAEWIAWQLEDANNAVILPDWDFQLGSRFEEEMQKAAAKAECTIIVLSPDFLNIPGLQQEWATIFQKSATSRQKLFLPIYVRECDHKRKKIFSSTIHIDITGQDEETARTILLNGVRNQRRKPTAQPYFPGMDTTQKYSNEAVGSQQQSSSIYSQPMTTPTRTIEIFLSYSHTDKELRRELEKYLKNLKRLHAITSWHDGEIPAGGEWAHEIEEHLSKADIILLLISQDFLASNYCYDQEMMRAMARHNAKEAYVIPIILRPAHWEITPFSKLQALPTGGIPITLWKDRDDAFLDVARGIQRAVGHLTKQSRLQ